MADLTGAEFVQGGMVTAAGAGDAKGGMPAQDRFRESMVSNDQEVTDGLVAAFNAHDFETAASFFGPRAIYVCPGGIAEGREEIASYFALYFEGFPDIKITPHSWTSCEDLVVIEWTATGTHTGPFLLPTGGAVQATGRRVAVRGCDIRTVEDELIASQRVYYDQLEMLTQLGVPCISE
ncbi:ester cyclase [Streptosporangium subroseum]|uniref:ester cyclase n=1 Tax=Streptosporangium subroseum TaxID=106412 RepID=UPI003088D4A0|nr:ester cyclase [Streptosporangium subroseum]